MISLLPFKHTECPVLLWNALLGTHWSYSHFLKISLQILLCQEEFLLSIWWHTVCFTRLFCFSLYLPTLWNVYVACHSFPYLLLNVHTCITVALSTTYTTQTHICMHSHACMHTHWQTHIHKYIHTRMHLHVSMYTQSQIHTNIHIIHMSTLTPSEY